MKGDTWLGLPLRNRSLFSSVTAGRAPGKLQDVGDLGRAFPGGVSSLERE